MYAFIFAELFNVALSVNNYKSTSVRKGKEVEPYLKQYLRGTQKITIAHLTHPVGKHEIRNIMTDA
jgi:hypothetical protein